MTFHEAAHITGQAQAAAFHPAQPLDADAVVIALARANEEPVSYQRAASMADHANRMTGLGHPISDGCDYTASPAERAFWLDMLSLRAALNALYAAGEAGAVRA